MSTLEIRGTIRVPGGKIMGKTSPEERYMMVIFMDIPVVARAHGRIKTEKLSS
jgi:hypothetical protein